MFTVKQQLDYAWLNLDLTKLNRDLLIDPFRNRSEYEKHHPEMFIIRLLCDPNFFPFTCKHILNIELYPYQHLVLKEMWLHSFPMLLMARGSAKTTCLGIYSILKSIIKNGSRIVIVGGGFRQAKLVFDVIERIYDTAPILKEIVHNSGGRIAKSNDRWEMRLGESTITAVPIGIDGGKIRGLRSNVTIADEFSIMDVEVFETVVQGFGVTSMNPVEKSKQAMRREKMIEMGFDPPDTTEETNQIIISGTPTYSFNHFFSYWQKYKAIIESRGDKDKLRNLGIHNEDLNWRDYCIIRMPYTLLPLGYVDKNIIARAKATTTKAVFTAEYMAEFITDSDGFFRRSLIESCVTKIPIEVFGQMVKFHATLRGDINRKYVYGIDPASEVDNFAIVILECYGNHRRIVYCWTIRKTLHQDLIGKGITNELNYFAYVSRKIRDLMKVFPCERIIIDKQGGGVGVMESLRDLEKLYEGELPIYEIVEDDVEKPTDRKSGLHIVEIAQFTKNEWNVEANEGLRKDMENKILLFPFFDPFSLAQAAEDDARHSRIVDTYEDCVMEIEEMKDELSTIVISQTPSGRQRWDTPENRVGNKKGRMRKDRYSALLIANMCARKISMADIPPEYVPMGSWATPQKKKDGSPERMYVGGPLDYNIDSDLYTAVRR